MKLLILCGALPPSTSATALLLDKLLPFFRANGVEVEGLTVKESFSDTNSYFHGDVTVHRANAVLQSPLSVSCFGDFVYKAIHRLRRTFEKPKRYVPLYKKDVKRGFLSALKRLRANRYDCIIAVCAHYDAAAALAEYKTKYAPHTPILLYQVDPLAENTIYGGGEALLAYEKSLYGIYDHVFTTPTVYKQKQKLGWDLSKVDVLMFPTVFGAKKGGERSSREEIRCVYAGQLYGGLRDARYTLELFSRIRDPRIHLYFVGRGQEELLREYEDGALKGRLHCLGEKTAEECDAILADADVLVNIGNTDKYLIPSKLFHYFGFGKPILNVVTDGECPSLPFVEQYGPAVSLMAADSLEENVAGAERWITENFRVRLSPEEISERLRDCSPQYVAEKIMDTINGVKHE